MLILVVLCMIFRGGSRSFQPALRQRLSGESNAIEAECKHTEGWKVAGDRSIQLHPCMLVQWADRQDFPMRWWSLHPWRRSGNGWTWHSVFWAGCQGGERGQRLELLILEVFSIPNSPVICFILRVSVQPCKSPSASEPCCQERQLSSSCDCLSHSPSLSFEYFINIDGNTCRKRHLPPQALSASKLKSQRCLQICGVLLGLNLA